MSRSLNSFVASEQMQSPAESDDGKAISRGGQVEYQRNGIYEMMSFTKHTHRDDR